ncbi:hypothetical protein Cch01nite_17190 [Cellulomonas chitinilytica]|uniref:HAF repeat-containing protein n=1 Tax=Cellulomonas chitinilytica TaxID=398759 RepID=A0A919P1L6_9CELL|nr:hypothetical protein [Cellulomonas chitinilytica]GIG20995.1 hypothetical protein Cch01nite_17190 [Cellulomonas chitinilytica]
MRIRSRTRVTTGPGAALLGAVLLLGTTAPAQAAHADDPGLQDLGIAECAQDVNGLAVIVTDTHVHRQGRTYPLPGGLDTAARLNDHGAIAGTDDGVAALWDGRRLVRIGVADPADTYSYATGLNERGDVVGTSGSFGGPTRAFVWRDDATHVLPGLGGDAGASDVNENGQVSGYAWDGTGTQHAVVWGADGILTALGTLGGHSLATAINNRGDVVGYAYSAPRGGSMRAVRWSTGGPPEPVDADGVVLAVAADINDRGRVVGNLSRPGGAQQGFLRDVGGSVRPVTPLVAGETTVLTAVNEHGTAVGCEFSAESSNAVVRYGPH